MVKDLAFYTDEQLNVMYKCLEEEILKFVNRGTIMFSISLVNPKSLLCSEITYESLLNAYL